MSCTTLIIIASSSDAQIYREFVALLNRLEVGRWSSGRPVFKKVDGDPRFLLVAEGKTAWGIRSSTTDELVFISSGKATNSHSSSEAGSSVRFQQTRWKFADGGVALEWSTDWREGDISVTCTFVLFHPNSCLKYPARRYCPVIISKSKNATES